MGNSKSICKNHKKNTSMSPKILSDQINNYLSENRQTTIVDQSVQKVILYEDLYPKAEKSNFRKITDSHHIVELSLDLISRHTNVEISKKTNEILYACLMYPPIFESEEKAPPIISTKSSNYILAQRAFDKIRDILMINEDGEYVPKEKTLRYKHSNVSQGSGSQQKALNNQSFLSFFQNNLNVSTTSYNGNITDFDKVSVRNFKRNPSIKSNIFDENKKRKSTKSLRNIIITETIQKKKSLIKINETRTERGSLESEEELVKELSPDVNKEKHEENKKGKLGSNIRRINYGYEIQKNLFKKFKKITTDENQVNINDTLSDIVKLRSLDKFVREGHLDLHKKLGKANYSWLKKILNLGGKKKSKNNQINFKINLKEIVKQTVIDKPNKKSKANFKRSTNELKRKNFMEFNNVSDTNQFNQHVEKFLGLENKSKPNKNKKQYYTTLMNISPNKLKDSPNNTIYQYDTVENMDVPYSEELKNLDTEEVTSEYETPDENNSYIQAERIKNNYKTNHDYLSGNSSDSSQVFYENMTDINYEEM